jgi:hypothetical protein
MEKEFELDRLYSKEKIYSVESIFNNFLSNFETLKIGVFLTYIF